MVKPVEPNAVTAYSTPLDPIRSVAKAAVEGVKDFGKALSEEAGAKDVAAGSNAAEKASASIDPEHLSLVRDHPDAHPIARHGESVTDSQLETRARTGVAPDGSYKTKPTAL